MSQATIKISGMSCNHCVAGVKKALGTVPGITALDVKVGEAVVEGNIDEAKIKEAIEDAGFDVVAIA